MPFYMDRHNTPTASAEGLAEAHKLDLAVQEEYGVRILTYWFDRERGAAFCLVDAPDAQSLKNMHNKAHGNVPTDVIEVDLEEVRAYLGRTENPPVPDDQSHPALDSPYRVIMFTDLQDSTGLSVYVGDIRAIELLEEHDRIIQDAVRKNNGTVIKHTGDGFLTSFSSVNDCLNCAVVIQHAFETFNERVPEGARDIVAEIASFRPEACLHAAWVTEPGVYLESSENRDWLAWSRDFFEGLVSRTEIRRHVHTCLP